MIAPGPPPIPADSADLREGAALHPDLTALLPLVGTWRGKGKGSYPTLESDFDYEQQVTFVHDGRPFLRYESVSWLIDEGGTPIRPAARELGWWRRGDHDPNGIEALLVSPTGIAEVFLGSANTATQWELATDAVVRTPSAKEISAEHRLYGIVERDLLYACDMAAVGRPLTPHISARLVRIGG
ncbi:MAG: FABP family protein [Mycobacteriales bacterium]